MTTIPPDIQADRDALLARTRRAERAGSDRVAARLDDFIHWSVRRQDLHFVPNGPKDQPGVAFAQSNGDLVWKAYPAGSEGRAKIEFFVRNLPLGMRDELGRRLKAGIGALSGGGRGVFAVALDGLREAHQVTGALAALEWALSEMVTQPSQ